MIVLHALWDSIDHTGLHVWAETSDVAPKRRKPARSHPFAATDVAIRNAIETFAPAHVTEHAVPEVVTVALPTVAGKPLSSPDLGSTIESPAGAASGAKIDQWRAPALLFNPAVSLDLLMALPLQRTGDVAFGSSLRFWAEAAKLALELATRQSIAPAVETDSRGECLAVWRAVLAGDDADRAEQLAKAMPPATRALIQDDNADQPPPSARDLLSSFLNHTVDALARGALAAQTWPAPQPKRKKTRDTRALPQQWLSALGSDDAALHGDQADIDAFTAEVQGWLSQLTSVQHAPFRTCFRLNEPANETAGKLVKSPKRQGEAARDWSVSFYLQANDDKSLLVPAEQVWQERSSTLKFLKHKFENPQERLLEDLGRASRLFPLVEESLNVAHPSTVQMNVEQAYAFLREQGPLLEQSGYGVLLPAWWQKPAARLGVKLRLSPKQTAKVNQKLMGQDAVLAYNWQIALGDQSMSYSDFQALASLKVPLVNVRGQWVELQRDEIERAIAFFKNKHGDGEMDIGAALRIGLGQDTSEAGLPVVAVEGEGWVDDLLKRLTDHATIPDMPAPPSFNGQLRPYQLRGVSWLVFLRQYGLGACLADDMGLGKTPTMIAALLLSRTATAADGGAASTSNGKRKKPASVTPPALIICPMSIVGNWQRELQRFAPSLRVMVHHGAERLADQAFEDEAGGNDVVLTTYALAQRDEADLARIAWDCLVLDEAQNIKNPSAKQTQAIRRLNAAHRIALTGTPVENRLSELWSIMEFLNKGYLGSSADFHKRFAGPIERYRDAAQSATLKRLIQPLVLRRLKTDKSIITDLPEKLEMKVLCNLTPEQATLYQAVVKDMLAKIESAEGIERRGLVLATLMKLKQVCNHPAHFLGDASKLPDRSGKLARLEEMLEEALSAGDKALIFTQFAVMGEMLRTYLQNRLARETLFLHGGVTKKQRDLMVERFQAPEGREGRSPALFILSIKAGGVGLNLTAANHVFHFDRWWNPAVENQATDRAFRIGQKKNVQVHKFVCVGTVEERIDLMIEKKKELAERIVGTGENWLTEMSTDQLRDLFALSREAVGD